MSTTFHLYRLQEIDSQIDETQRRLGEIQKILDDNSEVKRVKAYLAKCEAAQEKTEKILRKAEGEVKQQRIKIEQTEAMLYSGNIKNPKEVQDLQKKSESLKRHLATLEDVQLEAMLANDEENEILQSAKNDLTSLETKLAQEHSQLGGEKSGLEKEKARMLKERNVALPAVNAAHLELYNKLRKRKRGVAVAAINDGGCSACGATLTPGLQQKARSKAEFVYCTSCQRILYGN
ncbi:MAG: hypothetical protein HN736_01805 [Anaerolineae bacterium]|jgi:hypothetical protein|nr:hypothetical protein [Anaerolineae bacterium]MBT4310758.1 hypothetical protein [Anaerolineae bacterium]MBT4458244.1 hypothetical protein [Anaerolineae bacterium]MBT4841001.1 hypothetical protein [Anaerolineae bacterium]MBT6061125.1 hypothetical protein [Anaerolineae bacterium]